MKKLLLSLVVVLLPLEAGAAQRYYSEKYSCNQVRQIVRNQGEAVMRWTSRRDRSLPIYVRIVDNRSFCGPSQFAGTAYIPTRDTARCLVKQCKGLREFAPFDPFGLNTFN